MGEFYPGSRYFIHPSYAVDGLVNMQIYTKKGSGVKLTVWKASNRAFNLGWQSKGEGFGFKSRKRSADMLVKIQQKPILTSESTTKHPLLVYQISGSKLSDKSNGTQTTT